MRDCDEWDIQTQRNYQTGFYTYPDFEVIKVRILRRDRRRALIRPVARGFICRARWVLRKNLRVGLPKGQVYTGTFGTKAA